jgi:hypothetical protein
MAQLHRYSQDGARVIGIAEALNAQLAALAQCQGRTVDARTLEAMIDRARDLADDLANAVDALPDPGQAGTTPADVAERAHRQLDGTPALSASWSTA